MGQQLKNIAQETLNFYNSPTGTKIGALNEKAKNIKDDLMENLELLIQRNEFIDNLVDKSMELSTDSANFRSRARSFERQTYWQTVRFKVAGAVAAVLAVVIVVF